MAQGNITIHKYKDYEFVCWYWDTSNAWGHECRLCKNGMELARGRARYYNRTWECYTFQTVMFEALENYKKQELERFIDDYKYGNGYKGYDTETHKEFENRLPRGMKQKLEKAFEANPKWTELHDFVKDGHGK